MGPKNRLRAQDIHKIVDVFTRQLDIPKYSRMVGFEEIEKNEFNLNLPRYIDSQEPEDIQDIEGHLRGGIPERDASALERYWNVCPNLRFNFVQAQPSRLFGPGSGKNDHKINHLWASRVRDVLHRDEQPVPGLAGKECAQAKSIASWFPPQRAGQITFGGFTRSLCRQKADRQV